MTQAQQPHTEGLPWHVEKSTKSGYNIRDVDNNVPAIARVYLGGPSGLARAELLASAPTLEDKNAELRVALTMLLDHIDKGGQIDKRSCPFGWQTTHRSIIVTALEEQDHD